MPLGTRRAEHDWQAEAEQMAETHLDSLFCSDLVGPEVVIQQRPSWCLGCTQLPLRQLQCWKSAGREEGDLKPPVQGVTLSPFPECHRAGITEYAAFSDQITIFSVTDLEAFNKQIGVFAYILQVNMCLVALKTNGNL